MKLRIAAAFALAAASSLQAQTAPAPALADFSTAVPIEGSWSYSALTSGSAANFINTAAQSQVTVACTRATRQVTIAKPATGAAAVLIVWTSGQTRALAASYDPATGRISAIVSAFDPLLDAISFSRGRFALSAPGSAIVVPAWPEVSRVIEDCRV